MRTCVLFVLALLCSCDASQMQSDVPEEEAPIWEPIPADEVGQALATSLTRITVTPTVYPLKTMTTSFATVKRVCPVMLHTTTTAPTTTTTAPSYLLYKSTTPTTSTQTTIQQGLETTSVTTYAKVEPVTTTVTTATRSIAQVTIIQVPEAEVRETLGRFEHTDTEGGPAYSDGYRVHFRVVLPNPPSTDWVQTVGSANPCGG